MEYTYWELAMYLIIYSFIGWIIEVAAVAVKERKFCNRGLLNLPFCIAYGITMDILVVLLPTIRSIPGTIVSVWVVSSGINVIASFVVKRFTRRKLWNEENVSLFAGGKFSILISMMVTGGYLLGALLLHPVVYIVIHMTPVIVTQVIVITIAILVFVDFITTCIVVRKASQGKKSVSYQKKAQRTKRHLSYGIYNFIWNRLQKAYPNIKELDDDEVEEEYTFAKGFTIEKLIWVFLICALLGDLIETLYCRLTAGVWMSRSSVIYGPFSIVWGLGAVIITIILQKFATKSDRYVFLLGCVCGGVYEYMCSVFTEVVFGTVFWDYSWMPFNIGGRTNLLYCLFWGIAAVIWVKMVYPALNKWIEKIPPLGGKIATWVIVVLMVCDAVISAGAMGRYTERQDGIEATNSIQKFFDVNYDDELVETVYPNMKITD